MKAKITLLTVSIAILLTACGQKANGQINAVPPPATAVQEETQPPQPSTGPTTTGQSPAAASTSVQELSQEDELQPKATPQVTQTPEPVTEPAPAEDIPSSLSRLRPATMRTVSKRLRLKVSWNLPQHQSQRPNPQYPQTVKRPSTLPTPMRPHNTVSPRTQVWHWITAPTASQPQYRWMPRRKHWKPRRETW